VWPRAAIVISELCYLSFVSAAQDFSGYQSDGMLLESGFLGFFFAPGGLLPGLGTHERPSRLTMFSLQWVWFRIYFESGVAKIASGDPEWRHLTAMDHYYENGPLPTWIGWYVQHLPHWFHAATAFATLGIELAVVWMLFIPRLRVICFWIVTPLQMSIILTANYTFLNYLVLVLGFLLLNDRYLGRAASPFRPALFRLLRRPQPLPASQDVSPRPSIESSPATSTPLSVFRSRIWPAFVAIGVGGQVYAASALLILMLWLRAPLPLTPVQWLNHWRIADRYGLFGVMTTARYEIEFQGSNDGKNWVAYPFRYKPQDVYEPPGIYAPYQPRFDWNLWFASLETWRDSPFVIHTAELLLANDASVLSLFRSNPFRAAPPRELRTVIWRYWFTDMATLHREHRWWNREWRGLYAPTLERLPDGRYAVLEWPENEPR
jgi:hypothetical protein